MKNINLTSKDNFRIGIGLNENSLSFLEAKVSPGSNPEVTALELINLASFNISDQAAMLSELLKDVAKASKLKTSNVRLALDASFVEHAEIKIPKVSEEELAKGIKWQAEKNIRIPIDEAVIDFQFVAEDSQSENLNVIIVACRKNTIRDLALALKKIGLNLRVVDIAPFCIAKSVNALFAKDKKIAVVNIGSKNSFIIVVKSGVIEFFRAIDMGINNLLSSIKSEKGLDLEKAKELINSTPDASRIEDEQARALLARFIADFSRQVYRSVFYFNEQNPDSKINEIAVCGEFVGKLGLPVELLKATGLKTFIANPFDNLTLSDGLKNKFNSVGSLFLSPLGAIL